jgi:hypothetical protein
VTYAGLFQVVPPENVFQWQPAAAQLQQIWIASEHADPPRLSLTAKAAPPPGGPPPGGPSAAGAATASTAAGAMPYTGLEQAFGVLCADTDDPHRFVDYVAAARQARARSGPFGLLNVWTEAPCARWPRAAGRDRYSGPWNRRTASPILVIGNTGDPATAYQNSVAMARELGRARLLTVHGFGHTEFFNPSTCASAYEFRYLITGQLPPTGTVCQQTVMPFPAAG